MKRVVLLTHLVGALLLAMPRVALAQNINHLLITEVQTGSTTSASEEFVEIFNPTDQAVDISKYKIEYYSAASDLSVPSRSIVLHGVLYPGKYYLVASSGYLTGTAYDAFSAGLSITGGHILLVSPDPTDITKDVVDDALGWGTALHPEGSAMVAPADGTSLARKQDDQGQYVDMEDNSQDFVQNASPNPTANNEAPVVTGQNTDLGSNPNQNPAPPESQQITSYPELALTELLPNPAPPDNDSTDEYVEIYNPNAEPLDLAGYKIQTGKSYSYSYVFSEGTIAAGKYEAFMVSETGLLLANSGGKARLIDPSGKVVSETAAYDSAGDGQAWALVDGQWAWTTTPTPNEANILTAVLAKEGSSKSTTSPKTTSKKTTTPKSASTKKATTTKKSSKVAGATTGNSGGSTSGSEEVVAPIHPGLLAGVSVLALGYAAYEYRHDVANKIYQLRRYRAARREARKAAPGR